MDKNSQPPYPAVLVFLRAPEKGRVKTRLAKTIGERSALELYKGFVKDILEMLQQAAYVPTLCYYPADKLPLIRKWLGKSYQYHPQEGVSLGDKMANSFVRAFNEGHGRVVLIGTDVPDLPSRIIHEAFGALKTHPAVIGPSEDGGYYLIGFQRQGFLPEVFQNMPWGTETVLTRTLTIFEKKQRSVYQLPLWRDIDTEEDLKALFMRNSHGQAAYRTMAVIKSYSR